jgi:hypothetical protein
MSTVGGKDPMDTAITATRLSAFGVDVATRRARDAAKPANGESERAALRAELVVKLKARSSHHPRTQQETVGEADTRSRWRAT